MTNRQVLHTLPSDINNNCILSLPSGMTNRQVLHTLPSDINNNCILSLPSGMTNRQVLHTLPSDINNNCILSLPSGMTNRQVLHRVQQGYRLPRSAETPQPVYEKMLECWDEYAEQRPSFGLLQEYLDSFQCVSFVSSLVVLWLLLQHLSPASVSVFAPVVVLLQLSLTVLAPCLRFCMWITLCCRVHGRENSYYVSW